VRERVGVGEAESGGAVSHAFFTPSDDPVLTVWPPWCRAGAGHAARWSLAALGRAHLGGALVVLSDGRHDAAARLATVMAVDDAARGGHREDARWPLLDRLLTDTRALTDVVDPRSDR